jgi:Zn-dependent protease
MLMYSLLDQLGPGTAFTLVLLALLGLRANVTPRTSLWINTTPQKLWALVDTFHGKTENWGRTRVLSELTDAAHQVYKKTYTTLLPNGIERSVSASFRITNREEFHHVELAREGLNHKALTNELLNIRYDLKVENGGTRLRTTYQWGSRPLIAQLLARADLWSGAFRLKGLAETGKPNEMPYYIISAAVALVTGLFSLAAFAAVLNIEWALLFIIALFVHEFGHLLAYRMMGQPWGRMVFLPFLGAMAMPRMTFESQGQAVFAALMGPAFSIALATICGAHLFFGNPPNAFLCQLGIITAFLNLFNLMPAEPLDGGIALRSVLSRLIGDKAHYGLMAIGGVVVVAGLLTNLLVMVLFGGLAILANLKPRSIDAGLLPLTPLQLGISALGYVAITTAHVSMLFYFI